MVSSTGLLIIVLLAIAVPTIFWHRDTIQELSVPYARPRPKPNLQFVAEGNSPCLPHITEDLIEKSIRKHATCRKFAPFHIGRARIATVTAHFGNATQRYKKAFQTHLLHSLIHGTEVRVMCDVIVDDLWNKPAFILKLLMQEMLKSPRERLEWIMWVDRDTMILDQCRPISSFLPPQKSRFKSWWGHEKVEDFHHHGSLDRKNAEQVNLLVTADFNGLNNGVFILRVNEWAISLFNAILAFRYYRPEVVLPYTEQTAMEHVIQTDSFRAQTQIVPQYWFNAYDQGGARKFAYRKTIGSEVSPASVRRGDYLVHFAGVPNRGRVIEEYAAMLNALEDVWKTGSIQRDSSDEIASFWRSLGYDS